MGLKNRVLVAMSGGIDSSVTALMLHEQGYEVIGITMKTWDYATSGGDRKTTGCCSLDDINDARALAVDKGFPHYILDIREEFGEYIIDNFTQEYLAGRTPNPCVLCNTHIKWDALLKRADKLGCDFIATGHYANVRQENGRYVVSKGLDEAKDQSYVLWGLKQEALARTIFPMGQFRKTEIRQMALDYGYQSLAKKAESYEICFIPDNDYRGFLKRRVPGLEEEVAGGSFLDVKGNVIGKHDGYPFYTIGQRKGLGQAFGRPVFVTDINPELNTVTLGDEDDLDNSELYVRDANFGKWPDLGEEIEVTAKIRYKDHGATAFLSREGNMLRARFPVKVKAVTPGQSAVFYDGNDVVAGGFII
jgi:tRNA-specific 2-thiouridylase